jgi:hypothetical protein
MRGQHATASANVTLNLPDQWVPGGLREVPSTVEVGLIADSEGAPGESCSETRAGGLSTRGVDARLTNSGDHG